MHKKVIDCETLNEIIQKCIEKRLNEAFLDEGLMNSLGKAAGWTANKIRQVSNQTGKQTKDFKKGYNASSSNNYNRQIRNNGGTQYQDSHGPQPFPGLALKNTGTQAKTTQ